MLRLAKEYASDLFGLFYPSICLACSQKLLKGEEIICFRCIGEMPQTNYWTQPDNKLMKRFQGRVELQSAAAFLFFKKGNAVQHLLHELKYRKRKEVGEYVGKMFGSKLKEENSIVQNIDLIIPVPLHLTNLAQKGRIDCSRAALVFSNAEEPVLSNQYFEQ